MVEEGVYPEHGVEEEFWPLAEVVCPPEELHQGTVISARGCVEEAGGVVVQLQVVHCSGRVGC